MSDQTVFIVDDDAAIRDSIKELVESVGLTAQTYPSAIDFCDTYHESQPGCLVLDIRMANMSGLELQKKLNGQSTNIPIIFISGHGDVPIAVEAMKAGAHNFIQKPYHEHDLLENINAALLQDAENRTVSAKQALLKEKTDALTTREKEIMDLLANGLSNKEIAKQLSISPRTVEVHRHHILSKLGLKSVTQLAAFT